MAELMEQLLSLQLKQKHMQVENIQHGNVVKPHSFQRLVAIAAGPAQVYHENDVKYTLYA